jgi:DNA-binding transcriptional ArsR family regulator
LEERLTETDRKILAALSKHRRGLKFDKLLRITRVSGSLLSARLKVLQELPLVTKNIRTRRYKINKGAADHLFVKDLAGWLREGEPIPLRFRHGVVVTDAPSARKGSIGLLRKHYLGVLKEPAFFSHISRVSSRLMEARLQQTADEIGVTEKSLNEVLEYSRKLIEYMAIKSGLSVSQTANLSKPYSYVGWFFTFEEVNEFPFPSISFSDSQVRRLRKLRGFLRDGRVKARYDAFAKEMTNTKTALLVPLTGFGNYADWEQALKEIRKRARASETRKGIRS